MFASTSLFVSEKNRITYIGLIRHILSNISRVVSRDSSRTSATLNDLFVAICEDVTLYTAFKAMKGTMAHWPASLRTSG
jgi:hypothetical protein